MPFALVLIGMLLVVTGFQNTFRQMGKQVAKDFSGDGNFFYWIIAIGLIGSIGYVKSLETFSRAFMALIIVVLFLSKGDPANAGGGFFTQFNAALDAGSKTPVLPAGGNSSIGGGGGGGGLGSLGGFGGGNGSDGGEFDLSNIGEDVKLAVTIASFF